MKKTILVLFILFTIEVLYAPINKETNNELVKIANDLYVKEMKKKYKEEQLTSFLNVLGKKESGNNPESWNKLGYIGKYQFGKSARKSTGYGHITYYEFIKDPSIWSEEQQDHAMNRLLAKNQIHLKEIIIKCEKGKIIKGVKVTKSGILAAAHLSGATNVKRYFATNGKYNPKDIYGTSLEKYLLLFSGYNF